MIIGIIGSGNLGSAFAKVFSENENNKIILYDINQELINEINTKHRNSRYLPKIKFDKSISATTDISFISKVDLIIVCLPSQIIPRWITSIKPYYKNQIILCASKGLTSNGLVMTQVIESELRCDKRRILAISGPAIANELAKLKPTMTIIGGNKTFANIIKKNLETENFMITTTSDKKGIQLLGFYKNIIAILVGLCDGLKLGSNFQASLLTKAYNELKGSRFMGIVELLEKLFPKK